MTTPQPRPALRRASDANVHPALAVVPAREAPPVKLGAVPDPSPEPKGIKRSKRAKLPTQGGRFTGAGRSTSDTLRKRSVKTVDLKVKVPKSVRKQVRAVAEASGTTPDRLVTDVLNAWLGDPGRL